MVECHLTNDFGVLVQISLGVLAFVTLIVKRHKERPRRQWKIWGLDVSKQGISAVLAHFLNLLLAIIATRTGGDECLWYFVTFMMDTTLGVIICYLLVKALDDYYESKGKIYYKTGNYLVAVVLRDEDINFTLNSQPEQAVEMPQGPAQKKEKEIEYNPGQLGAFLRIDMTMWLVQLFLWNGVVVLSKVMLFLVVQLFREFLLSVAITLFYPLREYPKMELFLIMFFIPTIMNCFYFWVVDNFLKKQEITKIEEQLGIQRQLYEETQARSNQIVLVSD